MAITQFICVHRHLRGDGESKTVTIDFADEVAQSKITADSPDDVRDVTTDRPDCEVASATLSGSKVEVEFASPPPDVPFTLSAELVFGGEHSATRKKKHKDSDEAASHRHRG